MGAGGFLMLAVHFVLIMHCQFRSQILCVALDLYLQCPSTCSFFPPCCVRVGKDSGFSLPQNYRAVDTPKSRTKRSRRGSGVDIHRGEEALSSLHTHVHAHMCTHTYTFYEQNPGSSSNTSDREQKGKETIWGRQKRL